MFLVPAKISCGAKTLLQTCERIQIQSNQRLIVYWKYWTYEWYQTVDFKNTKNICSFITKIHSLFLQRLFCNQMMRKLNVDALTDVAGAVICSSSKSSFTTTTSFAGFSKSNFVITKIIKLQKNIRCSNK